MKNKEDKTERIAKCARTIRHLFRALNTTNDDIKWKDLAKVISIDANDLAEAIVDYLQIETHEREKIKLNKYVKAANGTLVSSKDGEKIRKIYRKIIDVTRPSANDVQLIIEALFNAILFYIFNSKPRILLPGLRGIMTVLYNHWERRIDEGEDIFN